MNWGKGTHAAVVNDVAGSLDPCSCSPPLPSLPAPVQSPVYHFHLQMGCCWTYSDLGLTRHMAKQSVPMPAANQELVQCRGLTPEPYGSTWCLSSHVYHKPYTASCPTIGTLNIIRSTKLCGPSGKTAYITSWPGCRVMLWAHSQLSIGLEAKFGSQSRVPAIGL